MQHPEFYATYQLLNVKNHHLYSSKFTLSVVDLTQTKLATKEDKRYKIDHWARIFKAKTWEELKMLAQNNEYLKEAADSIYKANSEEIVRQQCRAREDAERRERTLVRNYNLMKQYLAVANEENKALKGDNATLKEDNAALLARIRELEAMAESTRK